MSSEINEGARRSSPKRLQFNEPPTTAETTDSQGSSVRRLWLDTSEHIDYLIKKLGTDPPEDISRAEIELVVNWLQSIATALCSWSLDVRLDGNGSHVIYDQKTSDTVRKVFNRIVGDTLRTYDNLLEGQLDHRTLGNDTILRELSDIATTLRLRLAIEHSTGPWQPINTFLQELEVESNLQDVASETEQSQPLEPMQKPMQAQVEDTPVTIEPLGHAEYQYKPLIFQGRIRLLRLIGVSEDGLLYCQLDTYDQQDAPSYATISWAWNLKAEATIIVGLQTLKVSLDLELALRTICNPAEFRPPLLWIDMICCNKDDPGEMTFMMPQLASIYRLANHVYIWLGQADDDTYGVFQLFKDPRSKLRPGSLERFFARPWFSRLWTLQEVALGWKASLHCGRFTIKWLDFEKYVSRSLEASPYHDMEINELPEIVVSRVDTVIRSRQATMSRNDPCLSLEHLLVKHKDCTVTIQSGRIYALLALAQDVSPEYELRLNYKYNRRETQSELWWRLKGTTDTATTQDWTRYPGSFVTAYQQLFRHITQKADADKVLDIICSSPFHSSLGTRDLDTRIESKSPDLPSWLSMSDNSLASLVGLSGDQNAPYAASKGTGFVNLNPILDVNKDKAHLSVQGFILDTVSRIEENISGTIIPVSWIKVSHSMGFTKDEFWKTMTAARGFGGDIIPEFLALAIADAFYPTDMLKDVEQDQLCGNSIFSFHLEERVREVARGRNLCFTANGHISLVPKTAKAGDYICILYGCSVPVVLDHYGPAFQGQEVFSKRLVLKPLRFRSSSKKDRSSTQPRPNYSLTKDQRVLLARRSRQTRLIWAVRLVERVRWEQLVAREARKRRYWQAVADGLSRFSILVEKLLSYCYRTLGKDADLTIVKGLILGMMPIIDLDLSITAEIWIALGLSFLFSLMEFQVDPLLSYLYESPSEQLATMRFSLPTPFKVIAIFSISISLIEISKLTCNATTHLMTTALLLVFDGNHVPGISRTIALLLQKFFSISLTQAVTSYLSRGRLSIKRLGLEPMIELQVQETEDGPPKSKSLEIIIPREFKLKSVRDIGKSRTQLPNEDQAGPQIEEMKVTFVGACYVDGMMEGDAIPWRYMCNIPHTKFRIE